MSKPLAEFNWRLRAYMEDTDAGGIVYHVNYLKFMERARTESLRSLGFDKNYIFNQSSMFVVHSLNVDYKKPALLDEELIVEANVMQLKRSSIIFRQNIYRSEEVLCEANVRIACVDKETMKPTAMPDEIFQALSGHIKAN
jgi:tol-pal system-associated acyl-CoA thioesterase